GSDGVAMAHALIAMLRMLFSFGAVYLEDADCERLSAGLSKIRFQNTPRRKPILMIDQAVEICAEAHVRGWPSLALAQAFQFECAFRQKDVIGEFVPLNEPGPPSDLIRNGWKSIHGIRWNEIDDKLRITHVTS